MAAREDLEAAEQAVIAARASVQERITDYRSGDDWATFAALDLWMAEKHLRELQLSILTRAAVGAL